MAQPFPLNPLMTTNEKVSYLTIINLRENRCNHALKLGLASCCATMEDHHWASNYRLPHDEVGGHVHQRKTGQCSKIKVTKKWLIVLMMAFKSRGNYVNKIIIIKIITKTQH